MTNSPLIKREIPKGYTLFVGFAVLLTFTLNTINNRFGMADFRVYYFAAQQMAAGGQVYLVSFFEGSGFYKYSPVVLGFFIPYTLLSCKVASIIHFFILGLACWYAFLVVGELLKKHFFKDLPRNPDLLLILSFTCILVHFTRELYLGNVNIIMLLFCCLALKSYFSGRITAASLFLGLVILTKPFFLILLLPVILRKRWNFLAGIAIVLTTGLLLPLICLGASRGLAMNYQWILTIIEHNEDFPGMNSVDYLLRYYLFPSMPAAMAYVIILFACLISGWFIIQNINNEGNQARDKRIESRTMLFEWFLLMALLPLLLKSDWVQFLLSAPLIMLIIFHAGISKKKFWIPALIIIFLFFSANSDDLLGRQLSKKLLEMGVMGLSNMVLLTVALVMFQTGKFSPDGGGSGKF